MFSNHFFPHSPNLLPIQDTLLRLLSQISPILGKNLPHNFSVLEGVFFFEDVLDEGLGGIGVA